MTGGSPFRRTSAEAEPLRITGHSLLTCSSEMPLLSFPPGPHSLIRSSWMMSSSMRNVPLTHSCCRSSAMATHLPMSVSEYLNVFLPLLGILTLRSPDSTMALRFSSIILQFVVSQEKSMDPTSSTFRMYTSMRFTCLRSRTNAGSLSMPSRILRPKKVSSGIQFKVFLITTIT